MTQQEAFDAMINLYAHDTGCSSGINDQVLREEVKSFLKAEDEKPENQNRNIPRFLDPLVRDHFLSDKALSSGYGSEDVHEFVEWLECGLDT
jgi:hypothetical protein